MISLRLGAGKMVLTVLPPITVYFGVEVFRRESLLFADAPDLVAGFEPVTKTAQMVSPSWNRRRDRIVWTQGYTPFVRRVVPLIIIDVENLLRRLGRRQDQRLPCVRENAVAFLTNAAVSSPPAPIKNRRRSSMNALLQFRAHRRAGPIVAHEGPHRLSPPLPVRAGWRGRSPLWMRSDM
jgi:hypothetical protein